MNTLTCCLVMNTVACPIQNGRHISLHVLQYKVSFRKLSKPCEQNCQTNLTKSITFLNVMSYNVYHIDVITRQMYILATHTPCKTCMSSCISLTLCTNTALLNVKTAAAWNFELSQDDSDMRTNCRQKNGQWC